MTTLTLRNERSQSSIRSWIPKSWIKDLSISFLASVLIAAAAPLSLKLPFTPVPLSVQMNLVLILAAFLGSRRGVMMVLFFLAQGAMGFPVFAAGAAGIANLVGPRGGYLMGYLVASFVVGKLQEESRNNSPLQLFAHMAIGNLIVYLLGFAWLSQFLGMKRALILGILPFVIGDAIKLIFFSKLHAYKQRQHAGC